MVSRQPVVLTLALLCGWPPALTFGANAALPPPAEKLVEVCRGEAPTSAQLKGHYLELQTQRLVGKLPYPDPRPKDLIREWERVFKRRYTEDETARLERMFEQQVAKKARARGAPLTPDEIEKLESWYKARPTFRERLLLALNPLEDNVPAAVRVALAIREKHPEESETLENLTIAFAAVWDDPAVVVKNLTRPAAELARKPQTCSFLDSFGWYAQHQKRLCPWFATMPWRLQIHVAVESIPLAERDYVLATFSFRPNLGTLYSRIRYDDSKLEDNVGRLGKNPYTLENLLKYGGVCRDQAFFARSVCRTFGVPAYYANGEAATGDSHAWVGWIERDSTGYRLQDHGRYATDKYFTAQIADPASGKQIFDYMVGIEAKGLSDEKGYDEADLRYRVWCEVGEKLEPAAQTRLLIEALKRNPYHRDAWLALGDATASGALPRASADAQWQYLNKNFSTYPDFIYTMASSFAGMHETAADKYGFYEKVVTMFRHNGRQDIVAKLRLEQLLMCEEEDRKDLAAQVAITGMQECAGEGAQGVELARKAVALMSELKKLPALAMPLKSALGKTRQQSLGETNPHWVSIARLLASVYEQTGDTRSAEMLQQQIRRLTSK